MATNDEARVTMPMTTATRDTCDLDLRDPAFIDDPYPTYRSLRERAPILWSERHRSWIVTTYDATLAFFAEPKLTADRAAAAKFERERPAKPQRTLASEPPLHTTVRGLLNRSLNPAAAAITKRIPQMVDELLGRMQDAVESFLRDLDVSGELDLIDDFAYPLPIGVIAEMFDVPEEDRSQFQQWSHDIARSQDRFYARRGGAGSYDRFHAYCAELVVKRRRRPGDDLVSRLLAAEDEGERFTDEEVVLMCSTLLFAGHETTVNLVANGVLALLRHPEQLERCRDEPELAETAIEEFLRYDSPAQLLGRAATESFTFLGQKIEKGEAIVALLGSANRDPAKFEEPDVLDVGRRPNPHVSFGRGHHFCPGALLSRQEARIAVPALLRYFPRLRLADAPPVWRQTAVLRGLESFPVRVD